MCWFDTFVYCNMTTSLVLANTSSMQHNYHFFFLVGTIKIWFLSNLEVYSTALLTIISTLCISFPGLIYLPVLRFPLKKHLSSSPTSLPPGSHHSASVLLLLFNCWVVSDSFATPWTVACQAPLTMGFSRQECWSGLPFPSPEDLCFYEFQLFRVFFFCFYEFRFFRFHM